MTASIVQENYKQLQQKLSTFCWVTMTVHVLDCQGALNVAISNPDPNEVDIICPVYGNTCYSPEICHGCNDVPFLIFVRHWYQKIRVASSTYALGMFLKHLTMQDLTFLYQRKWHAISLFTLPERISDPLRSEVRLLFMWSGPWVEKILMKISSNCYCFLYNNFAFAAATADISVNTSSGEICFHSAEDCYLTDLTQYDVSITNFDGIVVFSEEDISEGSCVIVSVLISPDHAPLLISAQPLNDYIEYRPVSRVVISG